jgi:glycosyltransferase involved in cell wall biosynthesis
MPRPAILYVSYDGMLEPLGQSQVLAYLERLSERYAVTLLSFEKKADLADAGRLASVRRRIERAGIDWTRLRYHKAPSAPATAFDIAAGTVAALRLARRRQAAIVHARSYIAALIGIAVKRVTGARLLFDMRGLWADERVDAGWWPRGGRLYRTAKKIERRLLEGADHIVTLTHAAAREIASFPFLPRSTPITVIPTCADLGRFTPKAGSAQAAAPPVLGFVGTASAWSMLPELFRCHRLLQERDPAARLLIVNRHEQDYVRACMAEAGADPERVEIVRADYSDVPGLIARMTIGTALKRPSYSQLGCAPTKLAEYLGCGVPVLVNRGIGDVAEIVAGHRVGVVLDGFEEADLRAGVDEILALLRDEDLPRRCRSAAEAIFALEGGVAAYDGVYRSMLGAEGSAS